MKLVSKIESWTRRNLKWLLPFIVVMPFVLWYWNAHIDAIGYWLWLFLHGQKRDALLVIMLGVFGAVCLGLGIYKSGKGNP